MFAWDSSASIRRLLFAALAALLLLGLAPMSTANGHYRVDYVPYNLGFPLALSAPCDEPGLGSVSFCDALEGDYEWTKFTLSVRDDVGIPIGGYFEFRAADGTELYSGTFCKDFTNMVPLGARELYVEPGAVDPDAVDLSCLHPGIVGNVIVVWRVTPEAPLAPEPEEPCHDDHD